MESQIGTEFFHAFFEKYMEKQWGASCNQLPLEIVARIPIRKNRDDCYFTHRYHRAITKSLILVKTIKNEVFYVFHIQFH